MKPGNFYMAMAAVLWFTAAKAQQTPFVAHEWGTFTSLYGSNGMQLSDIYREEELLPAFVYKLSEIAPTLKRENQRPILTESGTFYPTTRLANVNVKMETPVIYFYAKDSFTAHVKVRFNNGLIGQWYPQCTHKPIIDYKETHEDSIAAASNIRLPFPSTTSLIEYAATVDFANAANTAEWRVKVNAPQAIDATSVLKQGETNTWTAPRETDANIISAGSENEKYIFYRGLGHFGMPVKVWFDTDGRLQIQNNGPDRIPYLFVYERKDDGRAVVYWTGALSPGQSRTVYEDINTASCFGDKLDEFEQALESAGLYDKEASAMLNTWKTSYFSHTGLRVFWIAPRAFTDQIIPLTIDPSPQELVRVLVGRSEILTPQFESNLLGSSDLRRSLAKDRFYLAMKNRLDDLTTNQEALDSVNMKIANQATANTGYEQALKTENISVYPNPATTSYTIAIDHPQNDQVNILFTDMAGHVIVRIDHEKLNLQAAYTRQMDISTLPRGIYVLQVQTGTQSLVQRVVKE